MVLMWCLEKIVLITKSLEMMKLINSLVNNDERLTICMNVIARSPLLTTVVTLKFYIFFRAKVH